MKHISCPKQLLDYRPIERVRSEPPWNALPGG